MPNKKFNLIFDASMNISQVKAAVGEIQRSLSGVSMPQNISARFSKSLTSLSQEIANFEQQAAKGISNLGDFKNLTKSGENILKSYQNIQSAVRQLGALSDKEMAKLFPAELTNKINAAEKAIKDYNTAVNNSNNSIEKQTNEIQKKQKSLEQLRNTLTSLNKRENVVDDIKYDVLAKQLREAKQEAEKLELEINDVNSAYQKALAIKNQKEDPAKNPPGFDYRKSTKGPNSWAENNRIVEEYLKKLDEAKAKYERLKSAQESRVKESDLQKNLTDTANKIDRAEKELRELQEELLRFQAQSPQAFSRLVQELSKIEGIDATKLKTFEDVQAALSTLNAQGLQQVQQAMNGVNAAVNTTEPTFNKFASTLRKASDEAAQFNARTREIENLKSRITYFFGITNSIMLFRRALRSAYQSVKALDEAMTQTAVVTDFTVGDMWEKLPEYTKRANQFGVAVKGVYEADTLYYQQGLKTNEVIATSNETLKMARIAGIEYAEATNYMTAALRGFNMEINEANAQRINDVYSKLAAITASNTQEIATAMTKTASIASNAGMEFETTAAFLSQIIETTREAPETAGTALKTVIARFQELKKDPLEIGEVDGETIDANKIETALRTIDVALRDTNGQFRNLDDVFLDIAEKWDGLDTNTQRYIATIAAGSRQQSRFIAMMSNYSRTMELVSAVNDSAGASQQQFEKTLDSLESKLAKLKNAWNEFTMGITNNAVIKFSVDALTIFINVINKLTGILPGAGESIAKFGLTLLGLRAGAKVFDAFFLNLKTMGPAAALTNSLRTSFVGLNKVFTANYWLNKEAVAADLALSTVTKDKILTTEAYNAALHRLALAYELNENQAAQYIGLVNLGIDSNVAAVLAADNFSIAQTRAALSTELGTAATEQQLKAKIEEIAATYASANAEKVLAVQKQKGLLGTLASTLAIKGETLAKKNSAAASLQKLLIEKAGLKVAAANIAMTLGLGAALIGAAWAVVHFYKKIKDNTPEEKLKKLESATEEAGEAAKKASEKYTELKDSLSSLEEKYSTIEDFAVGTQVWHDAVKETNNQVLGLIEKYKELAKYVTLGENGELILDVDSAAVQEVVENYNAKSRNADIAYAASNIALEDFNKQQVLNNLAQDYKVKSEVPVSGTNTTRRTYYTDEELEELVKRYARGEVGFKDDSDRAKAYREAGNKLLESENIVNAQYSSLLSNAIQTLPEGTTVEVLERAKNLANAELVNTLVENEKEKGVFNRLDTLKAYAEAQGYSDKTGFRINSSGIVYQEDGEEKKVPINDEDLKTFAAMQAVSDKAIAAMQLTETGFKNDILDAFFEGGLEGKGFTQADIGKIDDPEVYAKEVFDELPQQLKDFYGDEKVFADAFEKSFNIAADDFKKSQERLDEAGLEKINLAELNENLEYGAVSGLSKNFLDVNERLGNEAAESVYNELSPVFERLDDEQANNFAAALNAIDWSDANDISSLSENLAGFGTELGLTETEVFELEQEFIKLAGAIREVDVATLLTQTKGLRDTADDIRDREIVEGITQEEYDLIAGTNKFDMSQFSWTGQEYILTSGTMGQLADVLEDIAGQLAIEGAATDTTNNAQLRQEALLAKNSAIKISADSSYTKEEQRRAIETIKKNEELASSITAISKAYKGNSREFNNFDNHLVDVAINSKEAAKNFGGLNDVVKDNIEILKDPSSNPQGYLDTINSLSEKATEAFGTEVNTDFIQNNLADFISIGEGGEKAEEAYKKLGKKIAESFLEGIEDINDGLSFTIDEVVTFIESQYPELKVGGSFDASAIFEQFAKTAEGAAQLQSILNSLGYSSSFDVSYDLIQKNSAGKLTGRARGVKQENLQWFLDHGYEISKRNFDSLATKIDPSQFTIDSPSGGGNKGTGSTSEWKNPYDKQYNTIEQINEELRKREVLEKNFQRLQDQGKSTALLTLDYYNKLYKNLEGQLPLQEKLLEGRREELADLVKKNTQYAKYGSYDEATGLIQIDWDLIDSIKKTDTKTGEAVENYISEFERIAGSIEDVKGEILDIKQQQQDIKQELTDAFLSFEERVANAMEAAAQKDIDAMQEEFDALTEAEEALADAISKSIDEMRQARENEKTEDEIAEKERRLAYLRQDTTGSNALEIKRLEEEIAEQREEYQDALVDQALTNLQAQNEAAAEQRERQIELAQSQLEYNVENGVYVKQVAGLIESAMEGDHMLTKDDKLYEILHKGEDWSKLSEAGFQEMFKNLAIELNKAFSKLNADFAQDEDLTQFSKDYLAEMIKRYNKNGGILTQDILELNNLRNAKINDPNYTGSQKTLSYAELEKILKQNYTGSSSSKANSSGTSTANATKTYTVKAGDSLSKIAKKELGNMNRWKEIASLNGISSPYTIYPNQKLKLPAYKTGGVADFTGPAWLDGSKTKPELILNARDTENFIMLKDILSGVLNNASNIKSKSGDNYFDIDIQVDEIANDYDVDQMAERIKQNIYEDSTYRNVNAINLLR